MSDQLVFLGDNILNLLLGFPGNRPGGLLMSIGLAAVAVVFGAAIALIMGTAHSSQIKVLAWSSRLYVQVFRGIPLILLLLLIHQILGYGRRAGWNLTPLLSALIALTLYSSAYQSEIVRSGLRATPRELVETSRLFGGSRFQTFWRIKVRYTWHVMLPAFTGQAISLFKDTSVVIILGVAELMTTARIALGSDITNAPYWIPLYLTVGLFYFLVAFTLSRFAYRWEQRTRSGALVQSLASY